MDFTKVSDFAQQATNVVKKAADHVTTCHVELGRIQQLQTQRIYAGLGGVVAGLILGVIIAKKI